MAIEKKSQVPCTLSPKFSFVFFHIRHSKNLITHRNLAHRDNAYWSIAKKLENQY